MRTLLVNMIWTILSDPSLFFFFFLTNQDQITHNLHLDTQIHMQFQHVRSFSLAVRFPRAKTPKVRGPISVLSLELSSVAG